MPTLILTCEKCRVATLHRSPAPDCPEYVQCDSCGAMRETPQPDPNAIEIAAADAVRLLEQLPAMSQKNAHRRLEELLYEHRAVIVGSLAFGIAVEQAHGGEFELQDIHVESYRRDQADTVIEFTYYALGPLTEAEPRRRSRIGGTASGRIDAQGRVEIAQVTAAAADS